MERIMPTVGRMVHYVSYGTPGGEYLPEHRAAIITGVNANSFTVSLCVLSPEGMYFKPEASQDEVNKSAGSWHWPERV